MVTWVDAVKEYAKQNGGRFVIPKKDSDDYMKVKALQAKMNEVKPMEGGAKAKKEKPKKVANTEVVAVAAAPVVQTEKKAPKPKAEKKANKEIVAVPEVVPDPPKVRKPRAVKQKTPNVETKVEPVVEPTPEKAPKLKKIKVPNVEVPPVAPEVPAAPKVKKERVKKEKAVVEAATKKDGKMLIDRSKPVVFEFN